MFMAELRWFEGTLVKIVRSGLLVALLYNIMLWELVRADCNVVAYADDLLVIIEDNSMAEVEDSGTQSLEIVVG